MYLSNEYVLSNGTSIISNQTLLSKNLSLDAKGLYSVLLSMPDGSIISAKILAGKSSDTEDVIMSAIAELIAWGYLNISDDGETCTINLDSETDGSDDITEIEQMCINDVDDDCDLFMADNDCE